MIDFPWPVDVVKMAKTSSGAGVLTIWRENPEISVWSQMVRQFSGNSVRKLWSTFRGTPLFPFGTERRKFPYHLLNFPVSSLSSAENNYGKSKCKWLAPFRSVGLLILEKPLPLFNARPNRFILTNGKHPISPVRSEMAWGVYEIIHMWTAVVDQSEEWSSQ